jgi:hypothetical protein
VVEDLSSGILRQDAEIRWPDKLPMTVEEIAAFQKDNWISLIHLAALEIIRIMGQLDMDYQKKRWEFGEKKYGCDIVYFGSETNEAFCEVGDFVNWFTKTLLLDHFSDE